MSVTKTYVFEIGVEELPAKVVTSSAEQMASFVEEGLKSAHLGFGSVECYSTPRRITTIIRDLADATEPLRQVFKGPDAGRAFDAEGKPTKAAEGFARGKGIDASQLVVRPEGGKDYVWAEVSTPARPMVEVLPGVLTAAAGKLAFPRSQRWGSKRCTFSRPVRWLVSLWGDEVIPVTFCELEAGRVTRGHRLLNPGDYQITSADTYLDQVRDIHVILDAAERVDIIRKGIAEVEHERGLKADTPAKTFEEVVNLVEWPTVVVADFDIEFLQVPNEIICESMLSNQRYFPLYDAAGKLTNHFILVSNGDPARSKVIADGNERVVRARLSDAKFFYEEDLKKPLESYVERLSMVGFQKKLGTVLQKTARIEAIGAAIAAQAGLADDAQVIERAAHLSKADLVTSAVIEFTSQQGVMGGYYAAAAGEDPRVSLAITQQYRPRFAGDAVPDQTCGRVVAMADKLDTICGIFAIGEAPTGSSDPYAVRRSAIGVISILRNEPAISLAAAIRSALDALKAQGIEFDYDDIEAQVRMFFSVRLATIARDEGLSADVIDAVRAVEVIEPVEFLARSRALEAARQDEPETFDDLASAYTRANNLRDASLACEVDRTILGESELALLDATDAAAAEVSACLAGEGGYAGAIEALAKLRQPIDAFFDDVMVMDEDLDVRANRLRLLNRFVTCFHDVADIGLMARK